MFDTRVSLADVGIPARRARLTTCHRLPQEILSWAVRLRGGGPADGLVAGSTGLDGLRAARRGARPVVRGYVSLEAELAGLVAQVRAVARGRRRAGGRGGRGADRPSWCGRRGPRCARRAST